MASPSCLNPSSTPESRELTSNDLALLLDILNPVASKCYALGLQLGVKYPQMRIIEYDYRKCEDQLRQIIIERLKQESPLTWYDIVTALRSPTVNQHDLAKQIESQYIATSQHMCASSDPQLKRADSSLTNTTTTHTLEVGPPAAKKPKLDSSVVNTEVNSPLVQFIDYVKTIYMGYKVERDTKVVKWPPTPSKIFINLAYIDRKTKGLRAEYDEITEAMIRDGNVDVIHERKWHINFNQIAQGLLATTSERVVLVEGAPGVGKSTFAWEFCRKWVRGEIALQYQLVLLLRLRDERISKAQGLQDLIYHSSPSVCRAVKAELESTHGAKTLIILEGFDELPDSCRCAASLFFDIIYGRLLPLATVMVTSRPWATSTLHANCGHRIFQHIEILGFSSQQITFYIRSVLPESEAVGLEGYIEKHPQIRMCMYIPLNCAIVVTVYQESRDSEVTLPTTLTELYTVLVRTLLLRYLRGHPDYNAATMLLQSFNNLPPTIYSQFSELCKLAYSGLAGTSDHIQLIFTGLPSEFNNLGFMDSVTELYVTQGTATSHNFLHLTFQEFLAALHISNLSPAKQLTHFQRCKEGKLRVVLRFLAGITKLAHLNPSDFKSLLDKPVDYAHLDLGINYQVSWVYDAQREDLISTVFDDTTTVEFYDYTVDYCSLGYCVAHSQCQWVLSFTKSISEEDVKMFMAGANTGQMMGGSVVRLNGGVTEHYGTCCLSVSAEALNMIFSECKSVFKLQELFLQLPMQCNNILWPDLSQLRIVDLEIDGNNNWRLDTLLPCLSLESLTISPHTDGASIVLEDCVAIGAYISSATCLEYFYFKMVFESLNVDIKGLEAITAALSRNLSLPLKGLGLGGACTFTDSAAEYLEQFIASSTTLDCLSLYGSSFGAHGLLSLIQAVRHKPTLRRQELSGITCTVNDDDEAHDLGQLLVEYREVVRINVINANVSDAGVTTLTQALHHNNSVAELDLSNNRINDNGAAAIATALHKNSTLKKLDLSNNIISDVGVAAIAQVLRHNSTLEELHFQGNRISDDGAAALVQALHYKPTLDLVGNDERSTCHLV